MGAIVERERAELSEMLELFISSGTARASCALLVLATRGRAGDGALCPGEMRLLANRHSLPSNRRITACLRALEANAGAVGAAGTAGAVGAVGSSGPEEADLQEGKQEGKEAGGESESGRGRGGLAGAVGAEPFSPGPIPASP
eukprot:989127-Rhodomonas_salina.1